MGMMLKVLTLPFVPALAGFDPAPIEALTRQAEILEATPAFFERGGMQYWSVIVACRLHAGGPGAPAMAVAREGVRGVETARTAGGTAASGAYAPPQIPDHDRGQFQALRAWRSSEADRQGVPAYMILTNRNNNIGLRLASTTRGQWPGVHGLQARMRVVQAFIPLRQRLVRTAVRPGASSACRAKSRGRRGS